MNGKRAVVAVAAASLAAASMTMGASVASAQGGQAGVSASGACSGSATWKLKAKPDNGRIDLGLEVDSNRAGQHWSVRITDNGVQIFSGTRTTLAPSGSFTVNRLTANRAGTDRFVATSRDLTSGQTCVARVAL